jgi:chromosome partitioning protein
VITVIANLKGGSGKSTVTFNLALWLQMKGQEVTAYDLDPQATLQDVARVRREEGISPALIVNGLNGIYGQFTEQLTRHTGHVLIDVGAANMQAMKEAISVADRIIIPVPPSQPDVWATQRFLRIIDEAAGDVPHELIAFVNRADTHIAVRESDEAEEALNMMTVLNVLPHRLCQRTSFRRTLSEGLSIFELSPSSKSAKEFEKFAQALHPEFAENINIKGVENETHKTPA